MVQLTDTQDTLSGPEYEARCAALSANSKVVDEYVHDYELDDGENCAYSPNEAERDLITDAIQGLLADEEFVSTFNAWQDLCRRDRTLRAGQSEPVARHVTDEMVSRFLCWRLPDTFSPDCGITFKKDHPFGPGKYEPVGTNLFTAVEARAMLEHVLGGAGQSPTVPTAAVDSRSLNGVPWSEFETHFQAIHELMCRGNLLGGVSVGGSYKGWLADGRAVTHKFAVSGYERTGPNVERARAALRSTLPQTTGGKGS